MQQANMNHGVFMRKTMIKVLDMGYLLQAQSGVQDGKKRDIVNKMQHLQRNGECMYERTT